ncbi:MAG: hypothetical protein HGA45_28975 [Chloroflexales bacterium]|nr:hypothetical protein [Chloroflexales bacterium]
MTTRSFRRAGQIVVGVGIALLLGALFLLPQGLGASSPGPALTTSPHPLVAPVAPLALPVAPPAAAPLAPALAPAPIPLTGGQP